MTPTPQTLLTNSAAVFSYLMKQLAEITKKFQLKSSKTRKLKNLFKYAYQKELSSDSNLGLFIGPTKESVTLIRFFMKLLLISRKIIGQENLTSAFNAHLAGKRVIFFVNHTGVIDPPIINYLLDEFIEKNFPKDNILWTWVAGRRVWDSFLLRIFSRCSRMITVFGNKYVKEAKEASENDPSKLEKFLSMRNHNSRALRWMRNSKDIIFVFPEGTWYSDGKLHKGDPTAINVARIISNGGENETIIIKCFLEGADHVLPASGDPGDDFPRFLEVVKRGNVIFHVGIPENWLDILAKVPTGIAKNEVDKWIVDYIMRGIAQHAKLEARGVYA